MNISILATNKNNRKKAIIDIGIPEWYHEHHPQMNEEEIKESFFNSLPLNSLRDKFDYKYDTFQHLPQNKKK